MSKTYYEKLRDPRWQKMRLKVMERENFTCQRCGADNITLNVHHGYYQKGFAPWQYPIATLACLCEDCHEEVTKMINYIHLTIAEIGVNELDDIKRVVDSLISLKYTDPFPNAEKKELTEDNE